MTKLFDRLISAMRAVCDNCNGTGFSGGVECGKCGGSGEI